MSKRIDETRLQRLVDGALDARERRAFLVELDRQPESWREVALAFVEEQIWSREVGAMRAENVSGHQPHASSIPVATTGRKWTGALALAVGLIVAFTVGMQLGQWRSQSRMIAAPVIKAAAGKRQTPETQTIDSDPDIPAGPWQETEDSASEYRLLLPHEQGESVEMPVYEESQFDTASWDRVDPALIETLNERLSRRGYRADWRTEYLTGRLEDGRQLVVPWRTVSLSYAAQ
jgi:hypothetical protein